MAFDLDNFLKELGATGDEEASLRIALGKPERLALLEKGQLRQADYSRQADALKKEQEKLAAANDRVTAEMAEWAKLQAEGGEVTAKMRESLEKAEQKVLTLTQRVQRVAVDAGLDPVKALEGIDQVVPPKKDEPPPFDTSKFVGADTFGQMSNYLFKLATSIPRLAHEHRLLTGEELDTDALASEITERSSKKGAELDPRKVWEEKYGIPEKRAAKDASARAEEIKQAELRGAERVRTEMALPVPPSNGVRSPLLRTPDGTERKSVLNRPQPETTQRSAVAALVNRTYKDKPHVGVP
jgi:hypothetical protein